MTFKKYFLISQILHTEEWLFTDPLLWRRWWSNISLKYQRNKQLTLISKYWHRNWPRSWLTNLQVLICDKHKTLLGSTGLFNPSLPLKNWISNGKTDTQTIKQPCTYSLVAVQVYVVVHLFEGDWSYWVEVNLLMLAKATL